VYASFVTPAIVSTFRRINVRAFEHALSYLDFPLEASAVSLEFSGFSRSPGDRLVPRRERPESWPGRNASAAGLSGSANNRA
jgi:hypothetical protein